VPAPKDTEFVALSYIWGQSYASLTDSASVLSDLPCTIEDSISATLSLGYRYRWADRYVSIISCEILCSDTAHPQTYIR
jgi:hypothetical protein